MTTKRRNGSLSKTARLMYLLELQNDGELDAVSKNALANRLGVTRFTIYRDLADLAELQPIYNQLLKKAGKQS